MRGCTKGACSYEAVPQVRSAFHADRLCEDANRLGIPSHESRGGSKNEPSSVMPRLQPDRFSDMPHRSSQHPRYELRKHVIETAVKVVALWQIRLQLHCL